MREIRKLYVEQERRRLRWLQQNPGNRQIAESPEVDDSQAETKAYRLWHVNYDLGYLLYKAESDRFAETWFRLWCHEHHDKVSIYYLEKIEEIDEAESASLKHKQDTGRELYRRLLEMAIVPAAPVGSATDESGSEDQSAEQLSPE